MESDQSGHFTKRFTHSKKPITLEFIKGTLLAISEQMVSTISEVIQENAEYDKGKIITYLYQYITTMYQHC